MSIDSLADRYGITAPSVRARLACLSIDADQMSAEDLDKLDALNDHLKAGHSVSTFAYTPASTVEIIPARGGEIAALDPVEGSIEFDLAQLERVYTFLQNAADKGWHLPTSVIRSLTGATPRGSCWKRYGFEFIPATRHGGERAWAVSQAAWDFPVG